jgi:hypothetical protein
MSAHLDLQPAVTAGRTASAASVVLLVQSAAIEKLRRNKTAGPVYPFPNGVRQLFCRICFLQNVKWLTFAHENPGQGAVHRKAQADFNFRGWQGR